MARNERRASKILVHVIRGGIGAMRGECHVGKQGLRELSKLIEMLRISSYEHSCALEKRNNIMFQSRRAWDQKRDCLEPGELTSTKSFQDPMEMQAAISVGARPGT